MCPATAVKFYNIDTTNEVGEYFGRGGKCMPRCNIHTIRGIKDYNWITEMTPEEATCAIVLFE
jgi:hypothetical protein